QAGVGEAVVVAGQNDRARQPGQALAPEDDRAWNAQPVDQVDRRGQESEGAPPGVWPERSLGLVDAIVGLFLGLGRGRQAGPPAGGPSRLRRTFSVVVRGKSASDHQEARARRWCGARRAFAAATIGPRASGCPAASRYACSLAPPLGVGTATTAASRTEGS